MLKRYALVNKNKIQDNKDNSILTDKEVTERILNDLEHIKKAVSSEDKVSTFKQGSYEDIAKDLKVLMEQLEKK
jgi:hypothetical protein